MYIHYLRLGSFSRNSSRHKLPFLAKFYWLLFSLTDKCRIFDLLNRSVTGWYLEPGPFWVHKITGWNRRATWATKLLSIISICCDLVARSSYFILYLSKWQPVLGTYWISEPSKNDQIRQKSAFQPVPGLSVKRWVATNNWAR